MTIMNNAIKNKMIANSTKSGSWPVWPIENFDCKKRSASNYIGVADKEQKCLKILLKSHFLQLNLSNKPKQINQIAYH